MNRKMSGNVEKRGVHAARLSLEPGGTGSKLSYRSQHAQRPGECDRAGSSHTCLRRIAAGRKLGLFSCSIPPSFVLSHNLSMTNTTSNWLCLALFLACTCRQVGLLCPFPSWDKIPILSFVEFLTTRWKSCSTPDPVSARHRLAAFTFMAATEVHLAQANHHVALATCHPPYPTPSSATRNWVRFACVTCYEMLRFSGFFENLENRVFDASS